MAELSALERRLARQKHYQTRAREWRNGTKQSIQGAEVGLSVVVGALLGFVVDKNFDSMPWGTLIGLGFGVFAGGRTLYRITRKVLDADKAEQEARERELRG
jgi:ATP synthase protein I